MAEKQTEKRRMTEEEWRYCEVMERLWKRKEYARLFGEHP